MLTQIKYFVIRSVFDVTKGKSHYGAGGGYNHFAGRFFYFIFTWNIEVVMFLNY